MLLSITIMRNIAKASLWLLLAGVMMFAAVGCEEQKTEGQTESQLLVVEQQRMEFSKGQPESTVSIDVPLSGPSPLIDSVMEFLNRQTYDFCELLAGTDFEPGKQACFPYKKVPTAEALRFLQHYANHYIPKIDPELGLQDLTIQVIAQTESFVTFGVEEYHCGGSCGSEFHCYTFDKRDGHLVTDIISPKNLVKFIKKNPEADHPYFDWDLEDKDWDAIDWDPENMVWESNTIGLVEDGIICVNQWGYVKHYRVGFLEYSDIMSYLSKEAQGLVKSKDTTPMDWKDWHLGERIGSVTNKEGKEIHIAEYVANGFENDYNTPVSYGDNSLIAYSIEEGVLVRESVFPSGDDYVDYVEPHWDDVHTSLPDGAIYAFNPADNTLYFPSTENFQMGYHASYDRYEVYQFDGEHFVYKGEDGGFWLHPSIRQFGRLCYLGNTGDYLIRVDELRIYDSRYDDQAEAERIDTHRYRYTAWKTPKRMTDEPDLVINDGYESQGAYIFENNGYSYMVNEDMGRLYVYHGDKLILEQKLFAVE